MRKIFKIKLLKIFILILTLSFNAYAVDGDGNVSDPSAIEYLPGEGVITNTGKKMNVWTSKGSFKLDSNSAQATNAGGTSKLTPPQILVVREDEKSKRRWQRRNRR